MEKVFSGRCLCGAVRFNAANGGNVHTCSCDICQKHTGAQTVVWIEFPAENVQWIGPGGRPATWRSSDYSSRAFCPTCGSSIGAIDDAHTIAFLTGVFDDPDQSEFAPENHAFDDMKPAWWRHTMREA
ncbi:GFA family protein [Enterobacter quasiroggenkampii]|uniref:GFA family protein n=1 Tax=Enterobacter quasiroggenkampii TaxID=2497436 RepID=UPI0021D2A203|nr:GFA family protein [Enterobacter quasiroggenkampii]MCU6406205.1 GFA family protein [Enterobacter quasiroggenkampii]